MRDTFASLSLAAGVSIFYLARMMGTSVEMIDKTYGHMLPDSPNHIRDLLDAYDGERRARRLKAPFGHWHLEIS